MGWNSSPGRVKSFNFSIPPNCLWGPHNLLSNGHQGHEANSSPPTSAEIKKTWLYTCASSYVFMAEQIYLLVLLADLLCMSRWHLSTQYVCNQINSHFDLHKQRCKHLLSRTPHDFLPCLPFDFEFSYCTLDIYSVILISSYWNIHNSI
jgi:hypothetical protein